MSDKKDELLNSSYDGIQEYDNDLPRWWVALFAITVIVGVVYTWYIHGMNTPTDQDRLASDMAALTAKRVAAEQANAPKTVGPDQLMALAADSAHVEKGKANFAIRCAVCHGQQGEGLVGPNLTDEFWIHGGKIDQIQKTIITGVPAKGMLAWKGVISPEEIDDLTAFIWSIRNSNLKGKAPEGEKS